MLLAGPEGGSFCSNSKQELCWSHRDPLGRTELVGRLFELETFDVQWMQREAFSELPSFAESRASPPDGKEPGHSHQDEKSHKQTLRQGPHLPFPLKAHLSPPSSAFCPPIKLVHEPLYLSVQGPLHLSMLTCSVNRLALSSVNLSVVKFSGPQP